ncbi:MAG: isocitrate/isopropylmalate dehydrogenase family protein, partial [Chloroflexi bacterium]|nr:isocitrate/isopropylmalate dehydrogenase family protein [Chloroflexota bacterium]
MPTIDSVEQAKQRFGELLEAQQTRVDKIKSEGEPTDFTALDHIEIGVLGGDGIGPSIAHESQRVLEALLEDQVSSGRVSFRTIDGLTIERRAEELAAIPEGVLKEIHECDVTLKGPTTTPEQGDGWPNIESANVAMRKVLDLY